MDMVQSYIELFDGNRTAVGCEWGECFRIPPNHPDWGGDPWEVKVRKHLEDGGDAAIGVYPWVDGRVHWGCVDFDEGEEESWVHASNLTQVLAKFGITGWIERSRSKGFHVWVFHDRLEWMHAAVVRRGLLVACQVAGAPTKEVNPKSEALNPGQLGNYVRCPYPGRLLSADVYRPTDGRVVLTSKEHVLTLGEFVEQATASAGLDNLRHLASAWKPPRSAEPRAIVGVDEESEAGVLAQGLRRYTYRIWEEGPLEGSDRSGTLYQLCARFEEEGIEAADALTLIRDADERWGKKFEERPNGLRYLTMMVEKIYGVEFDA